MEKIIIFLLLFPSLAFGAGGTAQNEFDGPTGIGGQVDSKAILSCSSTSLGFLPPRMTTAQRDAITSPTEGLMIYNLTTHKGNYYNGTSWVEF